MKVFIISDIEGVAGIVKGEQTSPPPHGDSTLFNEGRKLYTEEINAAVRGAKAAGATEIVAMDCHGAGGGYTFNSLVAGPFSHRRPGIASPTPAGSAEGPKPRSRSHGRKLAAL